MNCSNLRLLFLQAAKSIGKKAAAKRAADLMQQLSNDNTTGPGGAAQTPSDSTPDLRSKVRELEQENNNLKKLLVEGICNLTFAVFCIEARQEKTVNWESSSCTTLRRIP